jgi:hypothetical protein
MNLVDWFFGNCLHHNHSWVFSTPKSRQHYVVCFDCGERVPYDWTEMHMVKDKAASRRIINELRSMS